MSNQDPIDAVPRDEFLLQLTGVLTGAFPKAGPVTDFGRTNAGVNSQGHIRVSTQKETFSIKTWIAAPLHQQTFEFCAEREMLIYNAAKLIVGLPHLCEIVHVSDFNFDVFKSRTVSVSRWLPDSVSIQKMDTEDFKAIRNDGIRFFDHFGRWLAFGATLGFQDWTPNNFVWATSTQTLSMIDMDWCLENHFDFLRDPLNVLTGISPLSSVQADRYMKEMRFGIDKTLTEIGPVLVQINEIIQQANDARNLAFNAIVNREPLNRLTERIEGVFNT